MKIKVPEGMLDAVSVRRVELYGPRSGWANEFAGQILEAALRWLTENPIVPTREQNRELLRCWTEHVGELDRDEEGRVMYPRQIAVEWQRRMFLPPDPEIPDEVKDLLYPEPHGTRFDM